MSFWTVERVASVLGCSAGEGKPFAAISTDTRNIEPGALFVALVGENFDGHDFVDAAVLAGASGVVAARDVAVPPSVTVFRVPDTLIAYGELAREVRRSIRGPVVAITGTNGKTSTKEMLKAVLGTKWQVHATAKNLNNRVGVPQTILSAPEGTEALVVEAGANEPGEIDALRKIIEPSVAVVTNVSEGHLLGFGSLAGVLHEKVSLLTDVPVAVVGTTPKHLPEAARSRAGRVVSAGLTEADVAPDELKLETDGTATIRFGDEVVRLSTPGRHQAENATLAWTVGLELGLEMSAVAVALSSAMPPNGRCEVVERDGITFIHDAYNANPASVRSVLDTALAMKGDRELVIVVGTMLELGPDSAQMHRTAAEWISDANPRLVGAVGEFVEPLTRLAKDADWDLVTADDSVMLGRTLRQRWDKNDLVVIKGSRGMRMERLLTDPESKGSA